MSNVITDEQIVILVVLNNAEVVDDVIMLVKTLLRLTTQEPTV